MSFPLTPAQELLERIGRVVTARRRKMGHSQESFADHVGMHRTYMGCIERGEKNLQLATLLRIAQGLGVQLSRLIADAEIQA
jgi:transcriptional regulator with XRE-family HTH domain